MISEIVDTQFADVSVPCAHDGKTIQIAIAPLCRALNLDAEREIRQLEQDEDLSRLLWTLLDVSGTRREGALRTLPLAATALWFARLADQKHDTALRRRLAVLQQEGFDTLLDQWLPKLNGGNEEAMVTLKRRFKRLQIQILATTGSMETPGTALEREIMHAQLTQLCCFPVCPRVEQSPLLDRFWSVLFSRMLTGVDINHARRADRLLALNFRHLHQVLSEGGADADMLEAVRLTPQLRAELKRSRHPYFLGVRVVNSRLARKSLRCWVFNLH